MRTEVNSETETHSLEISILGMYLRKSCELYAFFSCYMCLLIFPVVDLKYCENTSEILAFSSLRIITGRMIFGRKTIELSRLIPIPQTPMRNLACGNEPEG